MVPVKGAISAGVAIPRMMRSLAHREERLWNQIGQGDRNHGRRRVTNGRGSELLPYCINFSVPDATTIPGKPQPLHTTAGERDKAGRGNVGCWD